MCKKIGGGNKLENYIPKGNGPESGQYTNTIKEEKNQKIIPSKEELKKILTNDELQSLMLHTNKGFGTKLNIDIVNNTLSDYSKSILRNILNAISKYKLSENLKVYRGLHVSYNVFMNNFFNHL